VKTEWPQKGTKRHENEEKQFREEDIMKKSSLEKKT
jgi:hypothetical protein